METEALRRSPRSKEREERPREKGSGKGHGKGHGKNKVHRSPSVSPANMQLRKGKTS